MTRDRFGCPIPRGHRLFQPWRIAWGLYDGAECDRLEAEWAHEQATGRLADDLDRATRMIPTRTNGPQPVAPQRDNDTRQETH